MVSPNVKLCLRKALEKFMQEVVIKKIVLIDKSITKCYKNMDRI